MISLSSYMSTKLLWNIAATKPCCIRRQSMFEQRQRVQDAFSSFISRLFTYINFVLPTHKFQNWSVITVTNGRLHQMSSIH